jgi:signal transduction histidine kinase
MKSIAIAIASTTEGNLVMILTDDFARSAREIGDLYRYRWQIELFFKWIKQRLTVKHLYGESPQEEFASQKKRFDTMIGEIDRANAIITEFLSLSRNDPTELTRQSINSIVATLVPLSGRCCQQPGGRERGSGGGPRFEHG